MVKLTYTGNIKKIKSLCPMCGTKHDYDPLYILELTAQNFCKKSVRITISLVCKLCGNRFSFEYPSTDRKAARAFLNKYSPYKKVYRQNKNRSS